MPTTDRDPKLSGTLTALLTALGFVPAPLPIPAWAAVGRFAGYNQDGPRGNDPPPPPPGPRSGE